MVVVFILLATERLNTELTRNKTHHRIIVCIVRATERLKTGSSRNKTHHRF